LKVVPLLRAIPIHPIDAAQFLARLLIIAFSLSQLAIEISDGRRELANVLSETLGIGGGLRLRPCQLFRHFGVNSKTADAGILVATLAAASRCAGRRRWTANARPAQAVVAAGARIFQAGGTAIRGKGAARAAWITQSRRAVIGGVTGAARTRPAAEKWRAGSRTARGSAWRRFATRTAHDEDLKTTASLLSRLDPLIKSLGSRPLKKIAGRNIFR